MCVDKFEGSIRCMICDDDIVCPICGTWCDVEDCDDEIHVKCSKCGYTTTMWRTN